MRLHLPILLDQDYNAYRIEAQEVGFRLEIGELTFSLMDEALSKILGDERYFFIATTFKKKKEK